MATQQKAYHQLGNNKWSMSLNAFIAILYARGAFGAKTLAAKDLWDKTWGPSFFAAVMSRNRFLDIMRFFVLTSELREVCACKRISLHWRQIL